MQRGGANLVDVSLDICDTVIVESRAVKLWVCQTRSTSRVGKKKAVGDECMRSRDSKVGIELEDN